MIFGLIGALLAGVIGGFAGFTAAGILTVVGIGWGLGSLVGGALTKGTTVQHGPRLEDLTVQTSAYGVPITRLVGKNKVAGNIIWALDIIETFQKNEIDGGWFSDDVEYYTYSYTGNFQVLLGEGPIGGIGRVWLDNKLFLDYRSEADIGQALYLANNQMNKAREVYFNLHLGTQTQLPDPWIEQFEGVGNVSANRGYVTMTFKGLPLANYQNRLPAVTVETFETSTVEQASWIVAFDDFVSDSTTHVVDKNSDLIISHSQILPRTFRKYAGISDNFVQEFNAPTSQAIFDAWPRAGKTGVSTPRADFTVDNNNDLIMVTQGQANSIRYQILVKLNSNGGIKDIKDFEFFAVPGEFTRVDYITSHRGTGNFYGLTSNDYLVSLRTWDILGEADVIDLSNLPVEGSLSRVGPLVIDDNDPSLPIYVGLIDRISAVDVRKIYKLAYLSDNLLASIGQANDDWELNSLSMLNGTLVVDLLVGTDPTIWVLDGFTNQPVDSTISQSSLVGLDSAVEKICGWCGLQPSDIDVTDLAGEEVIGYAISSIATGNEMLDPLLAAFLVDRTEVDFKLHFYRRSARPVTLTIPNEDLGFGQYNSPSQRLTVTEGNDREIPSELEVKYFSIGRDYEINTQRATRKVKANALGATVIDFPLVQTDTKMKQLSEILLKSLWADKYQAKFALGPKYRALVPTDKVGILGRFYRIIRIDDSSGLLQIEGAREPGSYDSEAIAEDSAFPFEPIVRQTTANMVFFEYSLVNPTNFVNNQIGLYLVVWGDNVLTSARIDFSTDGGASYSVLRGASENVTTGFLTNNLDPCISPAYVDRVNSFTVRMNAGRTLSSATEQQMSEGRNVAAIGIEGTEQWEIVQFQTVVDNGDGTYTCSNLQRMMFGGVQNGVQEGSILILADSIQANQTIPEFFTIGQNIKYRAVANSQEDITGRIEDYALFGQVGLGWAPFPVEIQRAANDDIVISWSRRDRRYPEWQNSIANQQEFTDDYRLEIEPFGGGTPVRTVDNILTTSYTYLAADQSSDFGGLPTQFRIKVGHYSEISGVDAITPRALPIDFDNIR